MAPLGWPVPQQARGIAAAPFVPGRRVEPIEAVFPAGGPPPDYSTRVDQDLLGVESMEKREQRLLLALWVQA